MKYKLKESTLFETSSAATTIASPETNTAGTSPPTSPTRANSSIEVLPEQKLKKVQEDDTTNFTWSKAMIHLVPTSFRGEKSNSPTNSRRSGILRI